MSILLVHDENKDSLIALSEARIAGEHTSARHYRQEGSYLNIEPPANAREHDIDQLQQLGYRVATASEQNVFTEQKKQATTVQETTAPKGDK